MVGKGLADRRQHFGHEDIPVARVTELLGKGTPARVEVTDVLRREQWSPEPDCRTQAAHRNPRLMDEAGIVAFANAALVALQLCEAGKDGAAEDADARHAEFQPGVGRLDRQSRGIGGQAEAALGLAAGFGMQRQVFLHGQRHRKQVVDASFEQFEFDLADRLLAAIGVDLSAVQCDLDTCPLIWRKKPAEAREVGRKDRHQIRRRRFEKAPQLRRVDVRKIEVARLPGSLPLIALCKAPGRWRFALDGQQPLGALLAIAHRDPPGLQPPVGGVVVGVDQLLPVRLAAGEDRVRRQPACCTCRYAQLYLGFQCHFSVSPRGGVIVLDCAFHGCDGCQRS